MRILVGSIFVVLSFRIATSLVTTVSAESLWLSVSPNPLSYCPSSPLTYDCQKYQNDVWNVPSLASAPSMSFSESGDLTPSLLLVFLPGTGSTPRDFQHGLLEAWKDFNRAHILGQSYVSTPYPVSDMNRLCGDDSTNGGESVGSCLHRFHNNVVFGENNDSISTPLWSGLSSSDAIEQRVIFSLQTLHTQSPQQGWDQFYRRSSENTLHLLWDKVIISGHSQGGGHAAYIGYKRTTAKVVLLSSPQDCCSYSTFLDRPWRTPAARVSALFHLYEDARGVISYNLEQVAPGYPAIEFTVPFNPTSSSSQVIFSTSLPQTLCPCTTREQHCSTALDSCAPLVNVTARPNSEKYLYHQLWQFLAFGV